MLPSPTQGPQLMAVGPVLCTGTGLGHRPAFWGQRRGCSLSTHQEKKLLHPRVQERVWSQGQHPGDSGRDARVRGWGHDLQPRWRELLKEWECSGVSAPGHMSQFQPGHVLFVTWVTKSQGPHGTVIF